MFKHLINRYKDYIILFIVCCIGLWQISLFQNMMKWDIIDINLPWHYFISECIQNGVLPLWNPYIYCGFPQSADPMTWYPLSWFIGFFFGNDLMTIQYEYLFHVFIGGVGFYKLGELFNLNRETKLILAISFMFSGLFISNAQHFGWIVSAAWFPLILYHYVLFSRTFNIKNGILFILFLFFQLTGGYAGFFITTAYILAALFLYYFIHYIKDKKYFKYVIINISLAILFILLSSVVLVSSFEISTLLTRYNQLNIDYVNEGALPVKALISFILPFATTINPEFWGADQSLINSYFGIIPFIFLIYTLVVKKDLKIRFLFLLGVLFLCIALADVFPFRRWMFYLPFMNVFRFPTLFRFFAYFIFIILSGIGLNYFLKQNRKESILRAIIIATISILSGFFIYNLFFIEKWKFKKLLLFNVKSFLNSASIHDRIVLQAFIAVLILLSFLIILRKFKDQKRNLLIVVLVVFDMIIATQLNIYHTVISFADPKPTQQAIKKLPDGFPLPDMYEKMLNINDRTTPGIPHLWRNLNVFYKKTAYTGYSPYFFSSMFKAETEGLIHSVIKNPLFYLADSFKSNNVIDSLTIDTLSYEKIRIKAFTPRRSELKVNTEEAQILTFVQNYYPGWKAYINGKETAIIRSNYSFMSIRIPKGESTVVFQYRPDHILNAFYLSAFTFVLLLLFLFIKSILYLRFRIEQKRNK